MVVPVEVSEPLKRVIGKSVILGKERQRVKLRQSEAGVIKVPGNTV